MICVGCIMDGGAVYVGARLLCGSCFLRYSIVRARMWAETHPVSYMDTKRKARRERKRMERVA